MGEAVLLSCLCKKKLKLPVRYWHVHQGLATYPATSLGLGNGTSQEVSQDKKRMTLLHTTYYSGSRGRALTESVWGTEYIGFFHCYERNDLGHLSYPHSTSIFQSVEWEQ